MSLSATTPVVATPTPAVELDSAVRLSRSQLDVMRAFFCYEFEVATLDRESVPEATEDAVAEWIEALQMSGLFASAELRTMTEVWLNEPASLVSLLVGDVDEAAARYATVGDESKVVTAGDAVPEAAGPMGVEGTSADSLLRAS